MSIDRYSMNNDNKQNAHALLSASGSHRWIGCPASVAMEYGLKEETSEYAEEGIKAHKLASDELDYRLNKNPRTYKDSAFLYNADKEMNSHIQCYIKYLNNLCDYDNGSSFYYEQKVNFSNAVIGGNGTADAIIFNNTLYDLHIVDLKYGFNKVEAKDNTQMLLYAIGSINFLREEDKRINPGFSWADRIKTITLHIVQPRIHNFDTWTLTIEELKKWIKYFQIASIRALTLVDEFNPSDVNCKYCKAKKFCPALTKFVNERAIELKDKIDSGSLFNDTRLKKTGLDNDYIKKVLDSSALIKEYLILIENIAKERLIAGGDIDGYKVVQTMSCRKLNKDAENELYNEYGDSIYQKKLLNLSELEKIVGKNKLDYVTHKTAGNLALVKDNDKRLSVSENFKFQDLTINY